MATAADDRAQALSGPGACIGILGPLRMWQGEALLDLGGPQQRIAFAIFVTHRNSLVTTDHLIDILWGDRPPPAALATLRVYVSRLRKLLDIPDGAARIHSQPGGYLLSVPQGSVDADVLTELLRMAEEEVAHRRPHLARDLLESALGLFRGPPLVDFLYDDFARAEADRLYELRNLAMEKLVDIRMELGEHRMLIPDLQAMVEQHPLQEGIWSRLMLALYRSGRQSAALRTYQRLASVLASEVGVEPGPDVRQLEELILLQDPCLDHPVQGSRMPSYPTGFIGRAQELAEIGSHVEREPLVTLTGPAGAGKTRIAVELASRIHSDRGIPICWVDLSEIPATADVRPEVVRALGAREILGLDLDDLIASRVADHDTFIVLDNCEHVLEQAAQVTAVILRAASNTRVLATSRRRLGLVGEVVYAVGPLPVPSFDEADVGTILESEAVRLLMARASATRGGVHLDEMNATAAADVVRRLDGLPLAIELAAGALRAMSLDELARLLEDRFGLLVDGDPTGPSRQRTLETAVRWSDELLTAVERRTLRRLSVFPVSFDAAAAQAVIGEDGAMVLRHLVDHSLVMADLYPPVTRYRLLETVRAFASAAIEEDERQEGLRRHRDHYLTVAEAVWENMIGPRLGEWLSRARDDHGNFLQGIRWSLEGGQGDAALRLASALSGFWFRTSYLVPGQELLSEALRAAPSDSPWRPRALVGISFLAGGTSNADIEQIREQAFDAAGASGDPLLVALAGVTLAEMRLHQGRIEEAQRLADDARRVSLSVDFAEGVAMSDRAIGLAEFHLGNLTAARVHLIEARNRYREFRREVDAGWALIDVVDVSLALGDLPEALENAEAAAGDFRNRGDPRGLATALARCAQVRQLLGEEERARQLLEEALRISQRWGHQTEEERARELLAGLGSEESSSAPNRR